MYTPHRAQEHGHQGAIRHCRPRHHLRRLRTHPADTTRVPTATQPHTKHHRPGRGGTTRSPHAFPSLGRATLRQTLRFHRIPRHARRFAEPWPEDEFDFRVPAQATPDSWHDEECPRAAHCHPHFSYWPHIPFCASSTKMYLAVYAFEPLPMTSPPCSTTSPGSRTSMALSLLGKRRRDLHAT